MRFLKRSLTGLFLFGITIGILVVAGNTLYSAIQDRAAREAPNRSQREIVIAARVVVGENSAVRPRITTFGEIDSRRSLELRAPAGGTVVELSHNFMEGGVVAKGELLLAVDPSNAQSTLDVALADKNEAEVELRDAVRMLTIALDEQRVAEEQATLRKQSLERQTRLRERGVGTEAAVESTALAYSAAQQAVLTRRRAVAQAETRIEQAESVLSRRMIGVSEAERRLADTRLIAEFSGSLSDVGVVEGGLVTPNERVARLIDLDALEVSFRVSNAQYSRLIDDSGMLIPTDVDLSLDLDGFELSSRARIERESASVAEGQTGRLLFARLRSGQSAGLRPGDFVSVSIVEPELSNVTVLPSTALDSNGSVLVVGEEGRLAESQVQILRKQGNEVIVSGVGLAGEMVVAERSPFLGAGIRVRPIQPQPEGTRVAQQFEEPEMVILSDEERASLIEMVEANQSIPDQAKQRMLNRLNQDAVPKDMIERLRSRVES